MQVNNVSNVSFNAHIPNRLYNRMLVDLYTCKKVPVDTFFKQVQNVKKWGYETSCVAEEMGPKSSFKGLTLVNSYFVPFKKALLPMKDSLLSSFMALKEQDIIKAQEILKI